ncbi:AraC family transcriptional regulator [Sphingomonas paucimobilis]|nr:AraC family transcriptional regulator [Sphingomonas paucimobilis]
MDLLSQLITTVRVSSPLLSELCIGRDSCCIIDAFLGAPFHYVVEGRVTLTRGGETRELQPGDFLLMPRWTTYEIANGTGAARLRLKDLADAPNLQPSFEALDGALRVVVGPEPYTARLLSGIAVFDTMSLAGLGRALPDIVLLPDAANRLRPWTQAAMALVGEGERPAAPGFVAIASRAVEMLVSVALRDWAAFAEHEAGWLRAVHDERLARALNAMHSDPGRRWTLADLALRAGMSKSVFSETFLQMLGETPFDYLRRWRMHLATQQLLDTRVSVAQLASELGYRSALSFSRAFRATNGCTPAEFRRR